MRSILILSILITSLVSFANPISGEYLFKGTMDVTDHSTPSKILAVSNDRLTTLVSIKQLKKESCEGEINLSVEDLTPIEEGVFQVQDAGIRDKWIEFSFTPYRNFNFRYTGFECLKPLYQSNDRIPSIASTDHRLFLFNFVQGKVKMRRKSGEWPHKWLSWEEKDNICITQRLVTPRDRPARFWDYLDFSEYADGTNYESVSSPKSFLEWIAVKCPELIEKGGKVVGFTTDKVSKMRINYFSSKAVPFETQFEEQFVKFEDGKFFGGDGFLEFEGTYR